eukprot:11163360-Lingulodinium_polyedra.AAC.1
MEKRTGCGRQRRKRTERGDRNATLARNIRCKRPPRGETQVAARNNLETQHVQHMCNCARQETQRRTERGT